MAHDPHHSMTAAASLFGDGGGNDFFSTLQEEPQTVSSHDDLFTSTSSNGGDSADTSALFGSDASGGQDIWDAVTSGGGTEQHHSNVHTWAQDSSTTTVDDPYASQGWYDEYGQWHTYENDAAQQGWSNSDYTSTNAPGDTSAYAPSAYDYSYSSYPTANSTTQSTAENYGYSAYQPSHTNSLGANQSSTSAYPAYSQPQSAYDPYRPNTTSQARPPTKPVPEPPKQSYSYETPPPQPSIISKPETAEAYRPKTYDAYDPPILEKRSRKPASHPPPPQASSPYGNYGQTQASSYNPGVPTSPSYGYGHYEQPAPPPMNQQYAGAYGQNPPSSYAPPQAPLSNKAAPPPSHAYSQPNGHAAPNMPYEQNSYAPETPNAWSHAPSDHGYAPTSHHLQPDHYQTSPSYDLKQDQRYPVTKSPYNATTHMQPTINDDFYGSDGQADFYGPSDMVDLGEEANRRPPVPDHTPASYQPTSSEPSSFHNTDDWFDRPQSDEQEYETDPHETSQPALEVASADKPGDTTSPVHRSTSPYPYSYQPALPVSSPPNGHLSSKGHTHLSPSGQSAQTMPPPPRSGPPPRSISPVVAPPKSRNASTEALPSQGRRVSLIAKQRAASPVVSSMNSGLRSHTSSPAVSRSQTSSPSVIYAAAHLEAARNKISSPETALKLHGTLPPISPVTTSTGVAPSSYDPYKPSSVSSYSPHMPVPAPLPPPESTGEADSPFNPYARPSHSRHHTQKPSDGSNGGYQPSEPYSPYEPNAAHSKPPSIDLKQSGGLYTQDMAYNPMLGRNTQIPDQPVPHLATAPAYVPLASTSASDDFLGRAGARVPLITFGFGGKVVTCFHTQFDITSGFDVSLAPKKSSPVILRTLNQLVTDSVLDATSPSFPGPLFSDPGTPSVNLARSAASTAKAKKALVLKYLDERTTEIQSGLGYSTGIQRNKAESKLALVKLLKVMVEHDGQVSGSDEIDASIRSALLPQLANSVKENQMSPFGFATPAIDSMTNPAESLYDKSRSSGPAISYQVQPSAIDRIQELILQGERRKAYQYALDAKLWAHAMVISSSLDKDAWKESVSEFIKFELGTDAAKNTTEATNSRESLRVVYSVFAGHGASAVQELYPPKPLASRTTQTAPAYGRSTPFGHNVPHSDLPPASLAKWAETASMIASNPAAGDLAALSALGDSLASSHWIEAAHTCYLLSLATSSIGGVGTPSVKMILVGSENPSLKPTFHTDPDAIIFSEILEYSLSLIPVAKGQDAFAGLPHLQAYRLIRAAQLAEMGHVVLANRYCEAIGGTLRLNKPSAYYTTTFLTQLKELSDRLLGAPMLDKSGSWIARKMTKPSLDTIGSWLEGRLTKFIAGEGEEEKAAKKTEIGNSELTPAGPFAQYSVISSADTSPNTSMLNLSSTGNLFPPTPAPKRSGSAAALRPPAFSVPGPLDRSASAMDYRPAARLSSPSPQAQSANATTTSFYQAGSPYGAPARSRSGTVEGDNSSTSQRSASYDDGSQPDTDGGPWWGSSFTAEDATATPTAAAFHKFDGPAPDSSNFISLMDSTFAPTPSPLGSNISTPKTNPVSTLEEDEDDLGFGNNSNKKQVENAEPEEAAPRVAEPPKPKPAETKPASSGSWFPRIWGRKDDSTPAPIKANLGEETAFYYDKELKRWVNKKGGADTNAAPAPLPPPPSRAPSRAQTASPGTSTPAPPSAMSAPPKSATPPPRPATTGLAPPSRTSTAPPKRSQLAESFVPDGGDPDLAVPFPPSRPGSAFSAGAGDGLTPPPSRGSNIRRKGKSRYVDVFAQEQNGGTQ